MEALEKLQILRPDARQRQRGAFFFWEGTKDDSQSDSQSDQIRRIREWFFNPHLRINHPR